MVFQDKNSKKICEKQKELAQIQKELNYQKSIENCYLLTSNPNQQKLLKKK